MLFGLVYDESIKIVKEQKYLNQILEFKSKNDNTNKQFEAVREVVEKYMKDRT